MSKRYVSYTGPEFKLSGGTLKKRWAELHKGNLEPFPDTESVAGLSRRSLW
jgi:hypothetical protein